MPGAGVGRGAQGAWGSLVPACGRVRGPLSLHGRCVGKRRFLNSLCQEAWARAGPALTFTFNSRLAEAPALMERPPPRPRPWPRPHSPWSPPWGPWVLNVPRLTSSSHGGWFSLSLCLSYIFLPFLSQAAWGGESHCGWIEKPSHQGRQRQPALRCQLYERVASAAGGLLGPKGSGSVFSEGVPSSGNEPLRTRRRQGGRLLWRCDLEELERVTVIRSPTLPAPSHPQVPEMHPRPVS